MAQNIGVDIGKNLGISLIDSESLEYITKVDDFNYLMQFFADTSLEFKCVYVKNDGRTVQIAFQYDDENKEDDILWYYPVTKIRLDSELDRGMWETLFHTYGLPLEAIDAIRSNSGYYEVSVGRYRKTFPFNGETLLQ